MIVSVNDPRVPLQRLLDPFSEKIVGCFYPVGFPVESIQLDVWNIDDQG
jgi:hypothetical protein